MNPSCTQTNLVLDGLLALLACGKCKQTPERPIRLVNCGHLFCDSCAENDTVCRQCRTPVKSNEKRPHDTVARLINYCTTIKDMISNLDAGDLWPLANAIHQLTTDQGEKIEESPTNTNKVGEPTDSDENENCLSERADNCVDSMQRKKNFSENANIVNSLRMSKNEENKNFADSPRISEKSEKNNVGSVSRVDSSPNSKYFIENDLHPENGNSVNSRQISGKCKENNLHLGNVSFVHSTQILEGEKGENSKTGTPGYVDPTQISPIRRRLDSDCETPGYRDGTQVFGKLNDSKYDLETPGYRDPTQISQERDDENSADETIGYVEPTQAGPSVENTNGEPVDNWQDDMEIIVEDKDLFSPISETKCDHTLVPETPDMDQSISEMTIIPETHDADTIFDDGLAKTVTHTRHSDREMEEKLSTNELARKSEKMRKLQRKTYPLSSYERIGNENFQHSATNNVESVGKIRLRFNRCSTDPTIDRSNQRPTNDFYTRSVPDVRDSFMDITEGNDNVLIEGLKRKKNVALEKRQTRISLNERWTPKIDNSADRLNDSNTLSVEEPRLKQLGLVKDFKLDRRNKIPKEEIINFQNQNDILKNRHKNGDDETRSVLNGENATLESIEKSQPSRPRYAKNGLLTRSIETALNDNNTLGIDDVRNSIIVAVDVEKQRPTKHLRRLSDWEVDRQMKSCETVRDIPLTHNDAEANIMSPLRHWRNSLLDREKKTWTKTRETRELAKIDSMERANRMTRIKNRAVHRLNEDSFSDRDTIGLVDGADLLETAIFENMSNDDDSPMKRQSKVANTNKDSAMEIEKSDDEKLLPKHLLRLTDWPLNQQDRHSTNDSDTGDLTKIGDSIMEFEKIPEPRPMRQLRRLDRKPSNNTSIPNDIRDFDEEKLPSKCPFNETHPDISDVGNLLDKGQQIFVVRQLRRIEKSKLDRRDIMATDLHGIDITNIHDIGKEKEQNDAHDESDRVDASTVGSIVDEAKKKPQVKASRQLGRLQKLKPENRSIIASDLQDVDITNIRAFDREEEQKKCPMDESDTLDVANVDLREVSEKITELRSLKTLRLSEEAKPDDRSIIASDLDGVDITNIQDFGNDKHSKEFPMDESDTVDVSNVGNLLDESPRISNVTSPRQIGRLQKSKPNESCATLSTDLHGTKIQDFDQQKQNQSDTVDVSNVGELLDKPKNIPEIRPVRQIRRLQKLKPNGESTQVSNHVHTLDTTNSGIITEGPLVKKTIKTYENLSKKRPSNSPPNDNHNAENSDTETTTRAPLKQLSVENFELDTQNKIPAKRARAKIVQLKPRRRSNEKIPAAPKSIPKNVNKRNVKGETVLHNACVKGQTDYVRSLLEAGANPNTKDNADWTPLQEVVKLGKREICEMLLQFGASPNTPGIENRTALHDASQNDKLAEATLLLRFNASRDVYDKYGKRPIDYAISDEMRALLTDDNAIEKIIGEAPGINTTLDQSIITPNTKFVVLPANLNRSNKQILSKIASKLKVTVASSFRPGVTHIVVEANERNNTELTHHVMFAILQGIWILNSQWIAISMDLHDISEIDLELFEVHGAPNPGTPERARINEEKQNPRLFNNCFFYFAIGVRGNWHYGNLEFTKASLTKLVLAGQGEILKREPDPEDVKDNEITPFHVADKPTHSLHRCSHYIIYMPGKDEPRIKYNMPHIKTLPLAWLIECIEKFSLVDPVLIGIS